MKTADLPVFTCHDMAISSKRTSMQKNVQLVALNSAETGAGSSLDVNISVNKRANNNQAYTSLAALQTSEVVIAITRSSREKIQQQ